jgi:HEAT repeat protein
MSDSYHVTIRDFKGYTKRELDEMASDPNSLLTDRSKKRELKKSIKKTRKEKRDNNKLIHVMDNQMIEEIEQLKKNMFSSDWELVKSSADKLGEIGGDEITDFLISLLDLDDSGIRDRAALAIEQIGDNKAVEPLFKSIFKNHNYNGTMVFALESLDCSKHLKDIFRILFSEAYESKMSAIAILDTQTFDFTSQDLLEINRMWADCKLHPEKCPEIEDDEVKKEMQDCVDGFMEYLK